MSTMSMHLTKTGRVPAPTVDRWLRWYQRNQRIASDEAELSQYPNDRGLKAANERLKQQRDGWAIPDGFSSWEDLQAKLVETGQFHPMGER
jgi:hypothetical protein